VKVTFGSLLQAYAQSGVDVVGPASAQGPTT